jgi:hypothetical protein
MRSTEVSLFSPWFNSIIYIFIDICFTAIIKTFGRR